MTKTVCDRLGIKLPIVLAPMGGAVGPELAAAVSNAGGLGILPLWYQDIATLREIIRSTQALTQAPFAANLNMEFPQEERLEACLQEGVPIISFFWQDPAHLIQKAKDAGAIVMHTVGDAEAAKHAVDKVIATSPSLGDMMRYGVHTPRTDVRGEIEALSMWAGQTSALVKRVQPAAEIVDEIMAEARNVISDLQI